MVKTHPSQLAGDKGHANCQQEENSVCRWKTQIVDKHAKVFREGIGNLKHIKAWVELKDNATPKSQGTSHLICLVPKNGSRAPTPDGPRWTGLSGPRPLCLSTKRQLTKRVSAEI